MQFSDLKAQYAALKPAIDARIQGVLDHGQYIMGPEIRELEAALAAFTGSTHCIAVASGTEALLIALMAIGLEPGDEVITTPFTFAATAEMIVLAGGKPVFVDIEADTANIDATLIEAKITPRTKAVMPVSLYGQCADMAAINAIAARHGLAVIEDAAQSFGARYQGRRSTALSTFGATSFFPSKPLGCYGDGGALFTDSDALAQAAREIRVHGQSARYRHTRIGVGGLAIQAHRHDRPGARRDGGFDQRSVDVAGVGLDVDEDRLAAEQHDHLGGGGKSERRGDDFVARLDRKSVV